MHYIYLGFLPLVSAWRLISVQNSIKQFLIFYSLHGLQSVGNKIVRFICQVADQNLFHHLIQTYQMPQIEFYDRWRAAYRCTFCGKNMGARVNQSPGKEIDCYRCHRYSRPIKEVTTTTTTTIKVYHFQIYHCQFNDWVLFCVVFSFFLLSFQAHFYAGDTYPYKKDF